MRLARKGFTLIELMIVIAIIAIIAAIAIPNLIEARKSANETAAIGALKAIGNAQNMYREQDKDSNGALDYSNVIGGAVPSLATPTATTTLLDPVLASGTKQGYRFMTDAPAATNTTMWFAAGCAETLNTGGRTFFTNYSAIVMYDPNTAATTMLAGVGASGCDADPAWSPVGK